MSNYYFIGDGQLIESGHYPSGRGVERLAQELADECQCTVWVIRGEHAGVECYPNDPRDQMTPDDIDRAAEDARLHKAELDNLTKWNAMATR